MQDCTAALNCSIGLHCFVFCLFIMYSRVFYVFVVVMVTHAENPLYKLFITCLQIMIKFKVKLNVIFC